MENLLQFPDAIGVLFIALILAAGAASLLMGRHDTPIDVIREERSKRKP